MTKPAEAMLGNIALYRWAFCVRSNCHVSFEPETYSLVVVMMEPR